MNAKLWHSLASLSTVAITQVIFVCKRQVMQEEARSGGRGERAGVVSNEACIVLNVVIFFRCCLLFNTSCNQQRVAQQ